MSCDVLFQAERAESRPLICGCAEGTDLSQFAFLERLLEKMARQNGQTVEEPLACAIRFGHLKDDCLRVDFSDGDRLPPDDQKIALRGMSIFVEVDAEREEDILRVHRFAIGKFQTFPKDESVGESVERDLPGLGQRGLCELSGTIDMDEIGLHDADDFARPGVSGDDWIQGLWFATEGDD